MNLNLKLEPGAKPPKYATEGDAGMDFYAYIISEDCDFVVLQPGDRKLVSTGCSMAIPDGFELSIRPRSGKALKEGITVLNSPGTIDSGYRGIIGVIMYNASDCERAICHGDRIAQGVISSHEHAVFITVSDLDETDRGTTGFGDSGDK